MHRIIFRAARGFAAVSAIALCPTGCAPGPSAEVWTPVDFSKHNLKHHLVHASLSGSGKVEDYRIFVAPGRQSVRVELRMGHSVCGHPTIIHGGALAAVFDDAFGALFVASRAGNGFTANLSVDYRRPVPAGADLTLEATIDRVEVSRSGAKKVFFRGVLRSRDSETVYTEATALFIVKHVPSSEELHRRMGEEAP